MQKLQKPMQVCFSLLLAKNSIMMAITFFFLNGNASEVDQKILNVEVTYSCAKV